MIKTIEQAELSGHIIERTVKKMKLSFARMLQNLDAGVTVDQWVVLKILRKEDGLSQLEIARQCFKDPPTITRILDLLTLKGFVERRPDPFDRRRFKICLTPSGVHKIESLLPAVSDFRVKSYANVAPDDLKKLHAVLDTIFNNLDNINTV